MINAEPELVNSLMQYKHHVESSHRGSVTGRSFVQRDREECHDRMMKDYFIECPRFPAHDFQRRFRMRREHFESILNAIVNHDNYFVRKINVVGRQSLSSHQKLTSAFLMLANGCFANSTDEYCQLAESTATIYGATYLRKPNCEDLKRLLRKADKRGFPGMIGSLDCMHWERKSCPTTWAGQFKGRHNKPTIVLEAPEFRYKVNGNRYKLGYYLTDGIYPSLSTFVKSFSHPDNAKKKLFSQRQESYRKDVERAFGIVQVQWAIYIQIEEDSEENVDDDQLTHARTIARDVEYLATTTYETRQDRVTLSKYIRRLNIIEAPQGHDKLCKDLVEHVWCREGER
ncbi:unnamed protein product [Malus baccata var. baccata]